jgi:chitinase
MRKTLLAVLLFGFFMAPAQSSRYAVIGYYTGDANTLKQYPLQKLTHLIYSFLNLKGNQLSFSDEQQRQRLADIVALKKQYPHLKMMISLGGWEGCYTCSPVFASAENRKAFAASVLRILQESQTDGIDLDWEYPTIPGPPGHPYGPEDKANFTDLIVQLRNVLGKNYELSFAAGGFQQFLDEAVDWDAVVPLVDRINLMTYDLINGYSTVTGHHTALYSRPEQKESTDNCVQTLLRKKVPADKLVIGGAFYCRMWENVSPLNNGLYQSGKHVPGVPFRKFNARLTEAQGFKAYWDDTVKAMHYYNAAERKFATMDDPRSLQAKVQYMKDQHLGGIMFWQLFDDAFENGLLEVISESVLKQ